MLPATQRCILLRAYPRGVPAESDFEHVERPVGEPRNGQVLVETRLLSLDPAPRLRMNAASRDVPPLALGAVVPGRGVGVVLRSCHPDWREGDVVAGELGWQEYPLLDPAGLRRVDPALGPASAALGLLGPSGIAAWCLLRIAAPVRRGETVVVAAAAGAVGSTLVQLARHDGARVVALVASAAQARFVRDELAADAVLDCNADGFPVTLDAALPAGADLFLDSVGGAVHEAVVERIAVHGRVVAFGYISAYNGDGGAPREYGRIFRLIHRRATLSGFLVGDHAARFPEALRDLAALLRAGSLRNHEQFIDGLARAPAAFAGLFTGDPVGKQLLRVRGT
ncbi:MAG: NADP-dependent oxidoreductase [Steroidobacteraceae bacterium]|jgi:hypothetical protein|nr:NADP-dependent oxidoreductase [Steroidobacteraceae bacterium]